MPKSDNSLPSVFEQAAEAHRLRTAIGAGAWQPTYHELNETANRLAHAMLGGDGGAGDRVAILMQHDAPMIAAMIGALKAGRIVVVLNPADPPPRLRELLQDAEPGLILSDRENHHLARAINGAGCEVSQYDNCAMSGPLRNPDMRLSPDNIAFLCYTSGSAARPKAVMRTHRQEVRNARLHSGAWELIADDRIALLASLTGGLGISISWSALLHGAGLYPFPTMDKGFTGLASALTDHRITIFASTASFFRAFGRSLGDGVRFPQIRVVRLSSEPVTSEDFKVFQARFSETSKFIQTFGSSETGNIAQLRLRQTDKASDGRLPIGRPVGGIEVELLDERGGKVVRGQPGEIVVRSRYLAAGYWRNPELTARRFSGDLDGKGTRLFRTGDMGRINADGLLEFCGRSDDQMKIRGNRIELADVETALHRLSNIKGAVVEVITRSRGEPFLVGFVALGNEITWSSSELRFALRAALPDHMVPSEFVILLELPLTPAGKIDRDLLRTSYRPQRQRQANRRPKTETESMLIRIWAEVFELNDISVDDDFFALGGDSLMAAAVAARVHDTTGVQLNLAKFAEHPTLRSLALDIGELCASGPDGEPPLVPAPRTEPLPMSFSQERSWKLSQTPTGSAAYTMARVYRISGPLDPELFRKCVNYLARRHDILRTSFAQLGGHPVQIVNSSALTPLQFVDFGSAREPEAQANLIFRKEAAHVFDLTRTPLLRFLLVRLHENEHWLLRVSHHVISDSVSWVLYFDELAVLYRAMLRGEPPPLSSSAPLQYGDYAAWQRKVLSREGSGYRQAILWWKENLSATPSALRLPFRRAQEDSDVRPTDGMMSWGVERGISHRLNALSSARRATRPMVRLAAFAALLASETCESDVNIGMYASGRNRLPLQNVIGDFTNILSLRFRYDPTKSFVEWLSMVRDQVVCAEAHSAIPYEELCDELKREGICLPDIQVIFHVSPPRQVIEFEGLSLRSLDRMCQSFPWGFTVEFDDQNEQDGCRMLFDSRIYDPIGMREFVDRYKRLLDVVSRHPEQTLDELVLISCAGRAAPVGIEPPTPSFY